jgi:uncharacterized membrane protein
LKFLDEGSLRIVATFVAAVGIGVATYVAIADSGGGSPVCLGGSHGCATVADSSYSHLLGINLSLGGFGFSVYLTYLELFVIEAVCQWCVASAVLMTILFAANAVRMLRFVGRPA